MQKYKCSFEVSSKPHDVVSYTDVSVTRDRSGGGPQSRKGGRIVYEDSCALRVMTSRLAIDVETVTHAVQWLTCQCDAQITSAIIFTDSLNLPKKSLEWAAPIGTQPCTVFGCIDFCGSA